jgi:hypothetical protein
MAFCAWQVAANVNERTGRSRTTEENRIFYLIGMNDGSVMGVIESGINTTVVQ